MGGFLKTPSSSSIAWISYDDASRRLSVRFKHGGTYDYLGVPPEIFEAFRMAPSKGSFLTATVKERFPVERR